MGRARELPDDGAVLQEHQVRPELDVEGAAERAPGPVLDLDVPDLRMPGEVLGDARSGRAADAAPVGAELEHDQTAHVIDLLAGGRLLEGEVLDGHAPSIVGR